MQSEYPPAFERDMACTPSEWLRLLPAAIGASAWDGDGETADVRIGEGWLYLRWRVGEPQVIASVRLPRLHASFRFERVPAAQRRAFMQRFDLYMQRGGG